MGSKPDLSRYPGGELVEKGLKDLRAQKITEEALLVLIAEPGLRELGFQVPKVLALTLPYEHRLFEMIENREPSMAHSAYNALIQRIVSFAQAFPGNVRH